MSDLEVIDVMVACDAVECGYRIVELPNVYAFVWGNVRSDVGDVLPKEFAADPDGEKGVEVFDSYEAAERRYRDCAEALQDCGSRAGDEMLAIVGE